MTCAQGVSGRYGATPPLTSVPVATRHSVRSTPSGLMNGSVLWTQKQELRVAPGVIIMVPPTCVGYPGRDTARARNAPARKHRHWVLSGSTPDHDQDGVSFTTTLLPLLLRCGPANAGLAPPGNDAAAFLQGAGRPTTEFVLDRPVYMNEA